MGLAKGKSFSPCLLGISFLWAWNFPFVLTIEGNAGAFFVEVSNALHLGFALFAAVCCALFFRRMSASARNTMMLCATFLLVAASFLIIWGDFNSAVAPVWVGRALGGMGQSIAWIMWTYEISRYDWEDIDASFLGWMIFLTCFLSALVLVGGLPNLLAAFLKSTMLAACALLSFWTFRRVVSENSLRGPSLAANKGTVLAQGRRDSSSIRATIWLFVCLGFTLAAWFVVTFVSQRLCVLPSTTATFVYAIAALAMFPVAWLVLRLTRQFGPGSLYRWAVPTVVVGAVLCLLLPTELQFFPSFAFALAAIGFESMYHLLFIYLSKRFSAKGLLVASFGVLTTTVGGILVRLLSLCFQTSEIALWLLCSFLWPCLLLSPPQLPARRAFRG